MKDLMKYFEKIDKHFEENSQSDIYQNLLDAGLNNIEPSFYSGVDMVEESELRNLIIENREVYSRRTNKYKLNQKLTPYTNYSNELEIESTELSQVEVVA